MPTADDTEWVANNVVYSAIPDRQGGIWVGTNQGLCRVDRTTFSTRTYTQEDGLQADEFNRFHNLHLPDGRIILGGVDGITAFDPKEIGEDTYQPHVQITAVQVNSDLFSPVGIRSRCRLCRRLPYRMTKTL